MISVRDDADTVDITLTRVDHFSSAEDAARALWESAYEASKTHGGEVTLVDGTTVWWHHGPHQWADAYSVSDGVDAREFACISGGGDRIKFIDMD